MIAPGERQDLAELFYVPGRRVFFLRPFPGRLGPRPGFIAEQGELDSPGKTFGVRIGKDGVAFTQDLGMSPEPRGHERLPGLEAGVDLERCVGPGETGRDQDVGQLEEKGDLRGRNLVYEGD